MAEKIGEVEKVTVKAIYEWDDEPKPPREFILKHDTTIEKLIARFEKKWIPKKSGVAFFHGDVKLNGASTFAECNIPAGAILTVRECNIPAGAILTVRDAKRKREDSPPPVARSPTPPLPRE